MALRAAGERLMDKFNLVRGSWRSLLKWNIWFLPLVRFFSLVQIMVESKVKEKGVDRISHW